MKISVVLAVLFAVIVCMCFTGIGRCADGPVAYYNFSEGSGSVLKDVTGNGHNGTIKSATWTKSPLGTALKFDGVKSIVDLGKSPQLSMSGDSTFMAWIRLDAAMVPDLTTNWTVFSNEVYPESGSILRLAGENAKLYFRTNSKTNGAEPAISNRALAKNVFYHVAVVRKGDTVTLFIDGAPDVTAPAKGHSNPTQPLTLASSYQPMNGLMDEVKIYDRALSTGEVAAEYRKNAELMGKDTSWFGKIRMTPFLYLEDGKVIANVNVGGVLPLSEGESVSVVLSEAQKGLVEERQVQEIPASGESDIVFSTGTLSPGRYKVKSVLKDATGKEKASSEFDFSYPRALPDVPAPVKSSVSALASPVPDVPYSLAVAKGGGLILSVKDEKYPIDSYFSYPNGGYNRLFVSEPSEDSEASWRTTVKKVGKSTYVVDASGQFYSIKRTVKLLSNRVSVEDKITNKSSEDLGILLGNVVDASGKGYNSVLLAGNDASETKEPMKLGANSTVFLGKKGLGIGAIALDDVFITQSKGSFENGKATILSDSFSIAAATSYTLEWAVYPNGTGDYYDFINTVRKVEKRNGTIDGGMALHSYILDGADPTKEYVEHRGLKYIMVGSLVHIADDPQITLDGVDFLYYPKEMAYIKERIAACQKLFPDLKLGFHIAHSLWATNKPKEILTDSVVTKADGSLPLYSEGKYYFSDQRLSEGWRWLTCYATTKNELGRELMRSVDVMVDELGCKMVFMDGFGLCYGADFTYGEWDRHTADIDPKTKTIKQKKGSVALLQQDAMVQFARAMKAKGATVIANGTTPTRTVMRETYIIHDSEIIAGPHMHLTPTPAALSNPEVVMDKGEQGALFLYKDLMDKLRWSNLFFHYGDTSTRFPRKQISAYMYPFTFDELRSGYVKGTQRLVTMNSGVYGWRGDRDLHFVYLSDARGMVVPSAFLTTADAAGVRTRLDLNEDETVVLRKIPVNITSKSPVNVTVTQYDENGITFIANGKGIFSITVRAGDFAVKPGSVYMVNGKPVKASAKGTITLPTSLAGKKVFEIKASN